MSNRIADVCKALKTPGFLDPNGLRLVETSNPPSATSTAVIYAYEFRDSAVNTIDSKASDTASIYAKLRRMEGVLKDLYREIGGSERAIREEREGYSR